jgi:alanine transaminase
MYAFPQIVLPAGVLQAAKKANVTPDFFYCKAILDNAGICMVPGSGFGQRDGTYHFRTTFLPLEEQLGKVLERMVVVHKEFFAQYK